jgi:hypothetical protein
MCECYIVDYGLGAGGHFVFSLSSMRRDGSNDAHQ